jgi:hypothetical protein
MRINVADLMTDADLGGTTFARRRPTSSLASEGQVVVSYASASLAGIVQPAATTDANLLPEGVRISDVQAFFTAGDVSAGDGKSQLPDVLQYGGQTFRVLHVQAFDQHGMRKALAQLITVGSVV